jgi:hypothetical protein
MEGKLSAAFGVASSLKYSAKRSRCSSGVHAVFSPFLMQSGIFDLTSAWFLRINWKKVRVMCETAEQIVPKRLIRLDGFKWKASPKVRELIGTSKMILTWHHDCCFFQY